MTHRMKAISMIKPIVFPGGLAPRWRAGATVANSHIG